MQVFGGRIVPPDRHPAVAVLDIAQQIPHFLVQLYCDEESHGGSANCARTVSNIILIGLAGNARFTPETPQENIPRLSQKLQRKGWITYDNLYVRVQKNVARRDVSKTAMKGAKTIHFSLCIVDFGLQRTRKERFGQKRLHNLAIIVNQRGKQSGYLLKNVSIFAFFDPFRYILPNPHFSPIR